MKHDYPIDKRQFDEAIKAAAVNYFYSGGTVRRAVSIVKSVWKKWLQNKRKGLKGKKKKVTVRRKKQVVATSFPVNE